MNNQCEQGIIYYFSRTGNSLFAARELSGKLSMDLAPITQAVKEDEIRGKVIGIVCPVYMFNAPHIVYSFLEKIREAEYIFAVMTVAGAGGAALKRIREKLRSSGLDLDLGCYLTSPTNCINWHGAIPEHKQEKLKKLAQRKIKRITAAVTAREQLMEKNTDIEEPDNSPRPLIIRMTPGFLMQTFSDMAFKHVKTMDKPFRTTDNCTGCGICSKICPADNIEMNEGKPVWQHTCEQCLACIQWCPKQAIELGKETVGRERYHHMDVKLKDMLAQAGKTKEVENE